MKRVVRPADAHVRPHARDDDRGSGWTASAMIGDRSTAGRLETSARLMHAATPRPSLRQQLEGRARLVASVEKMRGRARARPALAVFAFAAAEVAALLVVLRVREQSGDPTPIAWHVENGAASARGYVSIPPTAPSARLMFADGSDVALAPGSRGRVARTTSTGAEVVLEHGRARVRVPYREDGRWLVDAGPFAVRVTGTEFLVAWSADAETLDVWMRSGRVEVTGPVLGEALRLSAGQHVRARMRDGTVQIDGDAEPPEPLAMEVTREPALVAPQTTPGESTRANRAYTAARPRRPPGIGARTAELL